MRHGSSTRMLPRSRMHCEEVLAEVDRLPEEGRQLQVRRVPRVQDAEHVLHRLHEAVRDHECHVHNARRHLGVRSTRCRESVLEAVCDQSDCRPVTSEPIVQQPRSEQSSGRLRPWADRIRERSVQDVAFLWVITGYEAHYLQQPNAGLPGDWLLEQPSDGYWSTFGALTFTRRGSACGRRGRRDFATTRAIRSRPCRTLRVRSGTRSSE